MLTVTEEAKQILKEKLLANTNDSKKLDLMGKKGKSKRSTRKSYRKSAAYLRKGPKKK